MTIYTWVGAATRLLLKRGVIGNTKISAAEEEVLQGEVVIKAESAERHHAMVNFWRTTLACMLGTLFWLWTGWTSGSGAMVMIAVVTALAMRLPNPRMVAIDFLYGTIAALPLGALYFGDPPVHAAEHVAALYQSRGDGILYRDRSAEAPSGIARCPRQYY